MAIRLETETTEKEQITIIDIETIHSTTKKNKIKQFFFFTSRLKSIIFLIVVLKCFPLFRNNYELHIDRQTDIKG